MLSDPPSSGVLAGIAGAPGLGIGKALIVGSPSRAFPRRRIQPSEVHPELLRFAEAVERAKEELHDISKHVSDRRLESSILEAYLLMVSDEALADAVEHEVTHERRCTEWAVAAACEKIAEQLAQMSDPYLRERSHDVEFVAGRLLSALTGVAPQSQLPSLDRPTILVAQDLSPADTISLAKEPVAGIVTVSGTRTSHTSIIARALNIPAVVGVADVLSRIANGDVVIVDGHRGTVAFKPAEQEIDDARSRLARYEAHAAELREQRDRACETKDGVAVRLLANVELPAEAKLAKRHRAQGIGLYRTEFLYIDRAAPPTEDEQVEVFRSIVEAMHPDPVTLRTFDIGGDKFVSNFQVPKEMNPMLGLRAVRLALSQPKVFLEHLRAMVRASAFGDVRIMLPMVTSMQELREARRLLSIAHEEVRSSGLPCAAEIPLGVMIEVPAAAVMVDLFAQEASFLSLGTNDLIQYALAVDRTSRSMAYLASPFDPAILRLIQGVANASERYRKPLSICGAMASDPLAAILLLGLGLRAFSMEAAAIPEIKEAFRRVELWEAEAVARLALGAATAEEAEHCVASAFAPRLYDLLLGES